MDIGGSDVCLADQAVEVGAGSVVARPQVGHVDVGGFGLGCSEGNSRQHGRFTGQGFIDGQAQPCDRTTTALT